MNKFYSWMLSHKKTIVIIFAVLFVASCIGFVFVNTNSDVVSYLPKDSDTIVSKDTILGTFGLEGDGIIAITGVTRAQMDEITEFVGKEEYIAKYVWLGMFDDIKATAEDASQPAVVQQELAVSYEMLYHKFYKEDTNTYVVGLYFSTANSTDEVAGTLATIEDYLIDYLPEGAEFALGGGSQNARSLLESSIGEIPKYLAIAVVLIFLVLLATTKSAFEPVILIGTLAISIVLNLGSNIILGTISTITFSATAILQLALSMDYSIFLMHAFYDEKKNYLDPHEAMLHALPKAVNAIIAAALTTVGGFIALFVMKFTMGFDLGFVLAKGVLLSLISVVVLQPILILWSQKPINKLTHNKDLKISFKKYSNFSKKGYIPTVAIAALLIIPCFIMQFMVPLGYTAMTKEKDSYTAPETVLLEEANQIILMVPYNYQPISKPDGTYDKKIIKDEYEKQYEFTAKLSEMECVSNVFSMFTVLGKGTYIAANGTNNPLLDQLATFVAVSNAQYGEYYTLYTLNLNVDTESEESYATLTAIRDLGEEMFGEIYVTGMTQGAYDLAQVTPTDFARVSVISALIVLVILILTFKKLKLSLIVLAVIELGIFMNLSLVFVLGQSINFMAYIIITAIQLCATVDYAILLTCKYIAQPKDMSPYEAIRKSVESACPSIFTSATILVIACASVYFVTSNVIVSQITRLIVIGASLSALLITTLLPSALWMNVKIMEKLKARKSAKA